MGIIILMLNFITFGESAQCIYGVDILSKGANLSANGKIYIQGYRLDSARVKNLIFSLENEEEQIVLDISNHYSYDRYNLLELRSPTNLRIGTEYQLEVEIVSIDSFEVEMKLSDNIRKNLKRRGYTTEQIQEIETKNPHSENSLIKMHNDLSRDVRVFQRQQKKWKIVEKDLTPPQMIEGIDVIKEIKYREYEYRTNSIVINRLANDESGLIYEVLIDQKEIMIVANNEGIGKLFDGFCSSNYRFAKGKHELQITPIDHSGNRGTVMKDSLYIWTKGLP